MKKNNLTPEEEKVIIHKGTERPFTGKYYDHKEEGSYHCKQCDAKLFLSIQKFDSGCGWPSFDDEVEGAIKRVPDTDGYRTEIICSNCGGHLGHVFEGEGFTDKNTRHCVNSISMTFVPTSIEPDTGKAIFASGCFWGVEYYFKKKEGVISTTVGYSGGSTNNPTYKEVCTGKTGHAEVVEVLFDKNLVSYEELTKLFFETHDPTQIDRQGPDIGNQYRSEIFYLNEKQNQIAEKLIKQLEEQGLNIATNVSPAKKFFEAENYHQDYYENKGGSPYCHKYVKRF